MKIVVLDGYTLNPGDLDWSELESLGELIVHDRTDFKNEIIIKTIGNADVVFTNKTPLPKAVLKAATQLKYIGVLATGYNVVDVNFAKELNIKVTNIPNYGTQAVAQFTFALLLEMCHHVGQHADSVANGEWTKSLDFCYWKSPLIELAGKTMGIIGFGNIGQATAKIAQTFGMTVLAYGGKEKPNLNTATCKQVVLDDLLAKSDVISLHCTLTDSTQEIINQHYISKMKDGVMIINTARGGLINEQDLTDALNGGKVGGAALDVVSVEPILKDNPLLTAKNCIITPHIAWASKESRSRLLNMAVDNLKAFINGKPINIVNG